MSHDDAPRPEALTIPERIAMAQQRAGVVAFATGRSSSNITASFRTARVVGMPAGWPVVLPRFGGVSLGAMMRPEIAERSLERMKEGGRK